MEFECVYTLPQDLEGELITYVQQRRVLNSLEYGFAQVQWRQLSIIFCRLNEFAPTPDSLLFFGGSRGLFIPETFPLREHLLFVYYDTPSRMLHFLGDMSLARYHSFFELGFISISDLSRQTNLLYDAFPPEEQFVQDARQFVNFYQPHFTTPDQGFKNVPLTKRLKVLQCIFDDVVHGIPRRIEPDPTDEKEEVAERELSLYEIIMRRFLCQKQRPMAFYYGCLLSSLNRNFHTEFVIHEQSRLYVLLELFFNTEIKRITFAQNWLRSSVEIVAPVLGNQYFDPPPEFIVLSRPSDLDLLQVRHKLRYPNQAQPGVYFRGPLINAPSLIEDPTLPVSNGVVSFTHYEMIEFLNPMVERMIQIQVDYFRQHCTHFMLERFVIPMLMHYKFSRMPVYYIENEFREANPKLEEGEVTSIIQRFNSELPGFIGPVEVLNTAINFVASLDNIVSVQDRFTVWPRSRASIDMGEAYYAQHPELKALHQELPPPSYQDLLDYAARCWPPCMQKLAANRTGGNHMRHEERIAMSAQLRRFGYSEKQGLEYWHLLFRDTDLYREFGEHNFLDSQQGLVIVYDYKRDRQVNTGVSCRNWIGKKFCPFVDIEELSRSCTCKETNGPQFQCTCKELGCQTMCKAKFSTLNPGHMLPYQVKSPRDYFFQARDSLGPALYSKKE